MKDRYYILAHSSLAEEEPLVLKYADTFGVFDRRGDMRRLGFENQGLFHQETRFLARSYLSIGDESPLLLSSNVTENNDFLVVDLTNPDLRSDTGLLIPRGSLHLVRTIFLWEGGLFESLRICNHGLSSVSFSLAFEFQADFVDIFEVRGTSRPKRGQLLQPTVNADSVTLSYRGLDKVTRKTHILFVPAPRELTSDRAVFSMELTPKQQTELQRTISCVGEGDPLPKFDFSSAQGARRRQYEDLRAQLPTVDTSNEQFNDWINRSGADIFMLVTRTPHGLYPFAGVPWFSTIFGRDGIITALETLWIYPDIARGVLSYLADSQAKGIIPEQEAQPGKILHEQRKGEMAALKEIPFGKYYGSVDATPLFIILAGYYYERTGDRPFLETLWPNIEAALQWIKQYGDSDRDHFVEYTPSADGGLVNQGWRDSKDSVFHADGELAPPPIALAEVQAYVYEAKIKASSLATVLGLNRFADSLRKEAETLKQRFVKKFWWEKMGTYVLALDGRGQPCRVQSSSAGQCLFTGIADQRHAEVITRNLLQPKFFSGWGVRTIAATEARYNPMSYHNGSIWPHDNALIAYGMARYGFKESAMRIMAALFDASLFLKLHRLPELYCGFDRRRGEGPTLYPVACHPQAWASGAVFLLLQACMGLCIQAQENRIYFSKPVLPEFLQEIHIKDLRVADSSLDIALVRYPSDIGVNVKRKTGKVEVIISK